MVQLVKLPAVTLASHIGAPYLSLSFSASNPTPWKAVKDGLGAWVPATHVEPFLAANFGLEKPGCLLQPFGDKSGKGWKIFLFPYPFNFFTYIHTYMKP